MKRLLAIAIVFWAAGAVADEYRAYWVDSFHTPLGTHGDIDRVIEVAVQSHANALFVEVRRRGDSWYLDSKDPKHVFLQHVWHAANNRPYSGPQQWATRSIPRNAKGTSYAGQRHGEDWYIDLGHPEAATYTIDVL